ncbi:MAG: hypothetical protein U5R14_12015 [Gemmatimonadota bacterium]|nr:hypothetical protein [Gemmatimonadota bacterium]
MRLPDADGSAGATSRSRPALAALALGLTVLACSNGATAPPPDGGADLDEGEAATRVEVMTVTAGADGSASVGLPEHLGTSEAPPNVVCSYTPDGKKWWIAFGDTACRLEPAGDGTLRVTIEGLSEGWSIRIEVHPPG